MRAEWKKRWKSVIEIEREQRFWARTRLWRQNFKLNHNRLISTNAPRSRVVALRLQRRERNGALWFVPASAFKLSNGRPTVNKRIVQQSRFARSRERQIAEIDVVGLAREARVTLVHSVVGSRTPKLSNLVVQIRFFKWHKCKYASVRTPFVQRGEVTSNAQ